MFRTSTGKPTKDQQDRFDAIKDFGCICCFIDGTEHVACEIHHLTSCGRRRGHDFTIGLCPYHHRGVTDLRREDAISIDGPSLAHGAKLFRKYWGADDMLLDLQNRMIGR
jgi:hypothetical protein